MQTVYFYEFTTSRDPSNKSHSYDMKPSPWNARLAVGATCTLLLFVFAMLDTEPVQQGHLHTNLTPVVSRMWYNVSEMPVSKREWQNVGFYAQDFDHAAARELAVKSGFGDLWDKLPNYAAKSDLFRLLVVHKHGGWYADADIVPLPGLKLLGQRYHLVLFNEACGFMWWNRFKYWIGVATITRFPQFRSNLFAAPKHWLPLRAAMILMESNVAYLPKAWSIVDQIDATGPGLFTRAVRLFEPELEEATIVSCAAQRKQLRHLGLRTWY